MSEGGGTSQAGNPRSALWNPSKVKVEKLVECFPPRRGKKKRIFVLVERHHLSKEAQRCRIWCKNRDVEGRRPQKIIGGFSLHVGLEETSHPSSQK